MNILKEIKKQQLEARKARESDKSSLLTCLISDIEMLAKNDGCRSVTDSDSIKVIKKYISTVSDNIDLLAGKFDSPDFIKYNRESEWLWKLLPVQLTDVVLYQLIDHIILEKNIVSIKDMKVVMQILKTDFDGAYDGTIASKYIKQKLSK